MSATRKYSDFTLYRRLLREARPFWRHIAGLFVLSLLATPLTLLNPLPLKIVVDSVLGSHALPAWLARLFPAGTPRTDLRALAVVTGLLIAIALAKQLLDLAFALLRSYTGEKLVLAFRAKLFRHSQGLSLTYHDTAGTADSTYRIQYDAPAIQWIAIDGFIPLFSSFLTLAAMMVVMARIDWALALVALTVAPVLYVVSQIYSRRLKLRWREAKDLESSTLSVVQEVLSSVRVVKAFAQEDREHERYVESARKNLREQIKLALTSGSFGLIVGVAMATGTALVLFLAAQHVQAGRITLGELILVMSYLALLYSPLQTVSKSAASLQGSLVSAERAFELLDEAPEVVEKPNARPLARARGEVAFANVSFGYNDDRPALHEISFAVPAGARVGIAGTTGAGKSTLVSLLLRLYDPAQGQVRLDGVDLRDYKLRDLRNQFAIVLQEPVLFSCSIAENIAYAKPEAKEAKIIAAAQAANAHDFISHLPQGYKTDVGERGVQLSGGERQRISLARAFLKDAPILILDEPTSSVDVKTEAVIMEAMQRLMQGRTTFMIAHRLSTLDICDVRIQLEQGRLVSVRMAVEKEDRVAVSAPSKVGP
jgi:ATP-binding cassette subfamily B protein